MSIADSNLGSLKLDHQPYLAEQSRVLIVDLEKFSSRGEALRYPEKTMNQGGGPTFDEKYVADIPAVMKVMKQIWGEFAGVIGYLDDMDQTRFESELDASP